MPLTMATAVDHINIRSGTFGGLFLVMLFQTNWYDILHSIIIAAVGASTSFMVSLLLRRASKKWIR